MESLNKLRVADLKKLLKQKNLSTDGNKATLINRILESGNHSQTDNDTPSEILDADEDLLLGNDDNSDVIEVKSSTDIAPSSKMPATTTQLESCSVPEKTTFSPSKILCPSVPEKSTTANGKMEERIKRFGVVSEEVRKKSRTERFQETSSVSNNANGTSKTVADASHAPQVTEEQLKKRAERFGMAKSSLPSKETSNSDLLKKRAERFGGSSSVSAAPATVESSDVMLKRKARFATSDGSTSEAKKQRRAERFGQESS